ncbi:DUF7573 domain-containing protein [Halorarum salinum]|uniref:DUF7573 domain-containing protein n=1 Tax=Halorarum salinum TaxID=2743089 RepID=A0A7D5L9H8_9EURY|nr:hypothetical protein [Halobaculum salinum]QLG61234.1 hypothetical protein HUG12_05590 [Halobaculum salinum]
MTGDHSLDDFLDAGGSGDAAADPAESGEPAPDPEPNDGVGEDERPPTNPESVDPAEPTYDWSPDGADCAACEETVTTRWRQDGAYVCADCKEW